TARKGLALKLCGQEEVRARAAFDTWVRVAQAFDFQVPAFPAFAIAPRALTKTPCRWHCAPQRQAGGIHRPFAGIRLSSYAPRKISQQCPIQLISSSLLIDPRSIPIVDEVLRIEPNGRLIRCAANDQVGG